MCPRLCLELNLRVEVLVVVQHYLLDSILGVKRTYINHSKTKVLK